MHLNLEELDERSCLVQQTRCRCDAIRARFFLLDFLFVLERHHCGLKWARRNQTRFLGGGRRVGHTPGVHGEEMISICTVRPGDM